MFALLQHDPGTLDVVDQPALGRQVHLLPVGFQSRLDVEVLGFNVATFTVPEIVQTTKAVKKRSKINDNYGL